ncbi:TPA: N-6 DNA methylase, partial [Candidatus Acetothermia bacterium]|nr:N-6 DNA methylase [Candidatus Acetothermia bacterium]
MAKARSRSKTSQNHGAIVGYEAELWQMADALRGSMDAAEYKHVVLGLIFLKYISDAFEEQHAELEAQRTEGADPEDPDEYRAASIFWVPPEARWQRLKAQAKQPTIGRLVDDAMAGIERDNPALKGVLPRDYARPALDKTRLGQLIDLISNIDFRSDQPSPPAPLPVGEDGRRPGEGQIKRGAFDLLGRIYEYFLSQFASAEGKKGGEFYTPRCVVKLLVEMIEPYRGRVYDPCCGSAGMFVQSVEFIRAHANGNGNGGKARSDISIYGQESNYTTWRLAKMNLAIRGIDGQIAHGDTFHDDRHPDLKADFILANPPFNVSDWGGDRLRDDKRWRYGAPPVGNANFAWVQHFIHHLAPTGIAGFVLANGSMSSNQSGEGEIRKAIIEADLVDCMVAL